jgi:hypothetical protein
MGKRTFRLPGKEQTALLGTFQAAKEGPTRTRYQAVRLYGTGYAVDEIMQITGCNRTSLMDWCRADRGQGLAMLRDHRLGGNRAKRTPVQWAELEERLHTYTPASLIGRSSCCGTAHRGIPEQCCAHFCKRTHFRKERSGISRGAPLASLCGPAGYPHLACGQLPATCA